MTRRRAIRFALFACVVVALVAFRAPLARAFVCAALDVVTGDAVSFDALDVTPERLEGAGVRVMRGAVPLFVADHILVRYRLGELFGGGTRRYGLERVLVVRPRVTLVRRADGGFDGVPEVAAGGSGPGAAPGRRTGPPLRFALAVRDGRVELLDRFRALPIARDLHADRITAFAAVDDATRTTYRGSALLADDPAQRLLFAGRIDAGGFASHRASAARVALPPIVDYFINSPSAALRSGTASAVDVRAYAFPAPGGARYHLVGTARVDDGAMHVPGLAVEATGMHGTLGAFDGGLVTSRLDARLGPLDVRLAGGLYDWRNVKFALGIRSRTDLAALRNLFNFSRRLPLHGVVAVSTFLEGPVGTPLVAARVAGPSVGYGRFPVTDAGGRAIYAASAVDVVGATGRYDGIDVRADGDVALGAVAQTQLVVAATGPAARVPYAAQIAPDAVLEAEGVLAGTGLRLDARGVAVGSGGGVALGAPFHVDPFGDGAFGPVSAHRDDGSDLAGTFYLDRSHGLSGFWLDAHDFAVADLGGRPRLPGIDLVAPAFAGRIDGAVAGVGPPSAFRVAGRVRGHALRVAGIAIDDVRAEVAGALANVRLGDVAAAGPWGRFAGSGAYTRGRLALDGRYDGSFERLRAFTGDVGASGPVAGPVALLLDPHRTVVDVPSAASAGALVRGIPLDAIAGTIAIADRSLRVYAATARVAGGTFAAAGSLAGTQGIGVSLAGADVARMGSAAPLGAGRVAAIGSVGGARGRATFTGGVALGAAAAGGVALAGDGDVTFGPLGLDARRVDAEAGGVVARIDGSIERLGTPGAAYDLAFHVPSADAAPLVRAVAGARAATGIAGTLGGDVRVTGTFPRLHVDGAVAMPEGTIDGLAFRDASARVDADAGGLRARSGHVTVGSTRTAFSASYRGDDRGVRLDARHADLADFNDLFDAGDTLGGRGRVALRFVRRGDETRTAADIAIAGLRYRRFDLGDARATWTSHGRAVAGSIDFGGASGRLAAAGTLVVPRRAPLAEFVRESRFDGSADLDGLDLGVWLPALGYHVPVEGRIDATAQIHGRLGDPAVTTVATVRDGSIGKFPVDRFSVTASSTLDRTTLRELDLELPSVSLVGSGHFGLSPRAPVALTLRATSSNLGALSTRLFGAAYPVTGTADAELSVAGTRASPRIAGRVDVRSATVRGVAVPEASGAFSLHGRDVVVRDAMLRLGIGSIELDGSVPLEIDPFAFGPPAARIALAFTANDVELSNFAPLLPPGSLLAGRIDGKATVGGTAGAPRLGGSLALASGSLQSPFETVALTDATARLRLDGDSARLDAFHAAAGGGTIDASGSARFADLIDPSSAVAYEFVARADKLRLALPAYGSGTIDGTLSFARLAGRTPTLAGDLRLSDGTIPFSALLVAGGGGGGGFDASAASTAVGPVQAVPPRVAFDLDLSAERNVRVRSANVDIGARGDLHVAGSLASPSLVGGFTSTGGTISYFNTVFRLTNGTVTFQPDAGLIPTLDAVATTHVINPDPNTVRNVAGSADVTLTLNGPVTNLSIGLRSDPSYERQQILGLLLNAPALGATNLFGENRGEATLYGSNSTSNLAPGVAVTRSSAGELSVAQEAFGVANAQFTRTLLAPLETTFAQAVGLSNVNVNVDYTGNVGVSARKVLGKNVNAIYGTSFGYPYRQTFGFEIKQSDSTAAQVTVFQTLGENGLSSQTPTTFLTSTGNPKYNAIQPSAGTAGFSLSLQHLF